MLDLIPGLPWPRFDVSKIRLLDVVPRIRQRRAGGVVRDRVSLERQAACVLQAECNGAVDEFSAICARALFARVPPVPPPPRYRIVSSLAISPYRELPEGLGRCAMRLLTVVPLNVILLQAEAGLDLTQMDFAGRVCGSFDFVHCGFALEVTEELKYVPQGFGDAVACARRKELRWQCFLPRGRKGEGFVVQLNRACSYMRRGFAWPP